MLLRTPDQPARHPGLRRRMRRVRVHSLKREELINAQYTDIILTDRSTLWRKTIDSLIQHMEDKAWIRSGERGVPPGRLHRRPGSGPADRRGISPRSFASRPRRPFRRALRRRIARLLFALRRVPEPDRLGVGGAGRHRAGHSHPRHRQRQAAAHRRPPGHPAARAPGAAGIAGMGIYATDIGKALLEMEQATHSTVLIVNRRGRLLAGSQSAMWMPSRTPSTSTRSIRSRPSRPATACTPPWCSPRPPTSAAWSRA